MNANLQMEQDVISIQNKVDKNFKRGTQVLFSIGVFGQLLFVIYILAHFGGIALSGNYEKVNEGMMNGIIEGDVMGNFMLGLHISLAAVITMGGPIQFITSFRKKFPKFHRWNGRIYYITAFLISFAGLYMNYSRGAVGGITGGLGNMLNASLIISFSIMAWRTAIQKDFVAHKKWAIRAFLMVSGVWFFRIGYGLWILLTGFTAPGTSMNLDGPFDIFLGFGHSLIPLILIELYFLAKINPSIKIKKIATASLWVLSVLLCAGIGMAAMIFWIPSLT